MEAVLTSEAFDTTLSLRASACDLGGSLEVEEETEAAEEDEVCADGSAVGCVCASLGCSSCSCTAASVSVGRSDLDPIREAPPRPPRPTRRPLPPPRVENADIRGEGSGKIVQA